MGSGSSKAAEEARKAAEAEAARKAEEARKAAEAEAACKAEEAERARDAILSAASLGLPSFI